MYCPLVISVHAFFSIIMITFLLDITIKTKHQNQFTMNIPSLASMLIYNNSTSSMSLVCNLSHNIISSIDFSNNFLSLNNHRILFLQTLLRNFYYPLSLTLSWSQSTSLLSRQSLFLSMTPSCLFTLYVFSKHSIPSHVISNKSSEFVSNFFHSLDTSLDMQLHFTLGYHPEGDGQTKYINQTLKQYLHLYCNYQQDNQSKLLSLVNFAYNNAPSTATGVFSLFTNKEYHLNIVMCYSMRVWTDFGLGLGLGPQIIISLQRTQGQEIGT